MKYFIILLVPALLLCTGCLNEDSASLPVKSYSSNEDMIHYLESHGDFINSADCPAVVSASEVNANRQSWLLLDIRPVEEYSSGHIKEAKNIHHQDLINFLDTVIASVPKVVIISKNGQSSAYYTSLLRLYGFNNVYSLSYGMASWNEVFANEWNLAVSKPPEGRDFYETIKDGERNSFSPLPEITFSTGSLSAEQKVKERAALLLKEEFPEKFKSSDYEISPSITLEDMLFGKLTNYYIICHDKNEVYFYIIDIGVILKHLKGTVYYNPPVYSDFRSTQQLQTIPVNKRTVIYSSNGELSAFVTAYLRVLGYNVSSMLFGINALYPDMIQRLPSGNEFSFTPRTIRNYTYEVSAQ